MFSCTRFSDDSNHFELSSLGLQASESADSLSVCQGARIWPISDVAFWKVARNDQRWQSFGSMAMERSVSVSVSIPGPRLILAIRLSFHFWCFRYEEGHITDRAPANVPFALRQT